MYRFPGVVGAIAIAAMLLLAPGLLRNLPQPVLAEFGGREVRPVGNQDLAQLAEGAGHERDGVIHSPRRPRKTVGGPV